MDFAVIANNYLSLLCFCSSGVLGSSIGGGHQGPAPGASSKFSGPQGWGWGIGSWGSASWGDSFSDASFGSFGSVGSFD